MLRAFQITAEDLERSSLELEDLGKWCIIVQGTYQGFWETQEQAEQAIAEIAQ